MNKKKYNLYISGGGNEKQSFALDKAFASNDIKKLLYIPVALERTTVGFEGCFDWISKTLGGVFEDFIEIDMCLDLHLINEEFLEKYDAIYIGGGNTYKLLDILYTTNSFPLIKDYIIKKKGFVYGGSAGAIIMGKTIETVKEENDKNYKHSLGLNVLGEKSVRCHFDASKPNYKVKTFKENNPTFDIICLPEEVGMAFDTDTGEFTFFTSDETKLPSYF